MNQPRHRPLILLVEDDPSMMSLLCEVCEMQNYEARPASTGSSALQLAARDRPDLVLLDWELPDISGIEVCQQLRRLGLVVPILMLSGRTNDRDVVTGLEHGVDEYLTKPVRPRVLAARLAANLRRAATEAPSSDSEIERRLALLERLSIFISHPTPAVRRLAKHSFIVAAKAGDVLLRQGEPNHYLFLIESGSFEVARKTPQRKTLPIAVLGAADLFGMVSAITGDPAAATVRARKDSVVVKITRDDLLAAATSGSPARAEIDRVVSQRIELLNAVHRDPAPNSEAQLICFYSPKGGVGKTTLAINLAAALAKDHSGEVVLIDLSRPYNHAALLAQLSPTTSLARLGETAEDFDHMLESGLAYHRAGFLLLATALVPEEADLISPDLVNRALAVLQGNFRFLIVDLGTALDEVALSLLEQSGAVFVIAAPELAVVKDLISIYGILRHVLKLTDRQIHVVVNHRPQTATVTLRDIERMLGIGVALEVGHDGKRPEVAALHGDILALRAPRSPIGRAAFALAQLATVEASGNPSR